ncbi:rodlin, partial [Streptomyces sp. NPDC055078]
MFKKVMATAVVSLSVVGAGAAMAAPAMAIGNDNGTTSVSGNGAKQAYGNQKTHGDMSPQMALVQGSLNKPCIGLPAKANVGSLIGV